MAIQTVIDAGSRQASFLLGYCQDNPDYSPPKREMDAAIRHASEGAFRGRIVAIAGLLIGGLGLIGLIAVGNIFSGALIAIGLVGALYCYLNREAASSLSAIQAKQLEQSIAKQSQIELA